MGWPQITWLALSAIGIGFAIAKHGEPRPGYTNAWASIIATGIMTYILYAGGFFT